VREGGLERRELSLRFGARPDQQEFKRVFAGVLKSVGAADEAEALCPGYCNAEPEPRARARPGPDPNDGRPEWARNVEVHDEEEAKESAFFEFRNSGKQQWPWGGDGESAEPPRRETADEKWARIEGYLDPMHQGQMDVYEARARAEKEAAAGMRRKVQERSRKLRWAATRAFRFLEKRATTPAELTLAKKVSEMLRIDDAVVIANLDPEEAPPPTREQKRRAFETLGKVLFDHADALRLAGYSRSVLWDRGSFQFALTTGKAVERLEPSRSPKSPGPRTMVHLGHKAKPVALLKELLAAIDEDDARHTADGCTDAFRRGKPTRLWWYDES